MKFKNKKFVYPKLPAEFDLGFMRIGGAGLANCMFVAARAWILHKETNYEFITPTWGKFSPGPYLRGEKDKRHYFGLFKRLGISGFNKLILLLTLPKHKHDPTKNYENGTIITVEGLGNYFSDLLDHHQLVKDYFIQIILKNHFRLLDKHDFSNVIGVHIRLGDYSNDLRTDIHWYRNLILEIQSQLNSPFQFNVFSDGTDDELKPITDLKNVRRVFFGNAFSDIIALSRCQLIIGSDSTFSGWGAFLGQVPVIFPRRHFGPVLLNPKYDLDLGQSVKFPQQFLDCIKINY